MSPQTIPTGSQTALSSLRETGKGRTVSAGVSARPSLPELPFTILVDREKFEVREIDGNRLSVIRRDERGSSHEAGAEVRLADLPVTAIAGGRVGGVGWLLRGAAVLLLVAWAGVGLAHLVLPRLGQEVPGIPPSIAPTVEKIDDLVADVLPPEVGPESLPFQVGLFLVPVVVLLLGLFVFQLDFQLGFLCLQSVFAAVGYDDFFVWDRRLILNNLYIFRYVCPARFWSVLPCIRFCLCNHIIAYHEPLESLFI